MALLLACLSGGAAAQPAVALSAPAPGAASRGCLSIDATVGTEMQLSSVRAELAGTSCEMQRSQSSWACRLDTSVAPQGTATLTVTATTTTGAVGTATRAVSVEPLPALEVEQPVFGAVLRAGLPVRARCVPAPGQRCSLSASFEAWTAQSEADAGLSADLCLPASLRAGEHQLVVWSDQLRAPFPAPNSVARWVLFEPQLALAPTQEIAGRVLDADAERVLALSEAGELFTVPRGGGARTSLGRRRAPPPFGTACEPAFPSPEAPWAWLVPGGAVVVHGDGSIQRLPSDGGAAAASFCEQATPSELAWGGRRAFEVCGGLTRDAGTARVRLVDVDARGNVLALSPADRLDHLDLVLLREGRWTTLVDCAARGCSVVDGRLDGDRVLYSMFGSDELYELADAGQLVLTARFHPQTDRFIAAPQFGTAAAARGGWTVWPELVEPGSVLQLFRRAPDGGTRQLTAWQNHSHLETLAPNGELTYFVDTKSAAPPLGRETPSAWRRRVLLADGQDRDVSSAAGTARWGDAGWEVALGNSVFRLDFDAGTPGCTLDAADRFSAPRQPGCVSSGAAVAAWLVGLVAFAAARRRRGRALR